MNKTTLVAAGCGLALMSTLAAETAPDPNVAEAKAIMKEFFASLKGELEAAIAAGGPASAILVCQAKAPGIAAEMSEKTGWNVGRTSLKLRNAKTNAPDEWETRVLLDFEKRKASGEDVTTIAYAERVEVGGEPRFRFMKAIPTSELCLNCHGAEIEPQVAAAIDAAYPEDEARGFGLGDIRGAFTLSKPL